MTRLMCPIGEKFGRWVVVADSVPDRIGRARWLCKCSCEKETERIVAAHHLLSNRSKSCGCIRGEKAKTDSKYYDANELPKPLSEWAKELGIFKGTLWLWLKNGLSTEDIINKSKTRRK